MVSKFDVVSKLIFACGMILFGSSAVGSSVMAQSGNAGGAPFIGFRPFGGEQAVPASASGTASRSVGAQAQVTGGPRIIPEQPASAYPYPASGGPSFGAVSNSRTGTAERASLGGRLPSTTTPTGSLNNATSSTVGQGSGFDRTASGGQAAGTAAPAGGVDPALWQRYQQELQQQQAQQQYQQYQQWLAQQQQYRSQRQASSVGYRSQQTSASGQATPANNRAVQPSLATRANTTAGRTTTAKMNQPVVQQVSSTTTSNRDSSVAPAAWSSAVASKSSSAADSSSTTNSTSVAKQTAAVANSVAKPQCCCVPTNCCVATTPAPTTPAPVFRPQTVNPLVGQAANQIPSLQVPAATPNVNSTFGGFLGQAGANYQVQPLGSNQFQSGLGVPQFRSTGALGSGNGIFGTGAYTPLLPLVNAQGARLGQGIIGQPTAYMDGQPLRNLLRYISP